MTKLLSGALRLRGASAVMATRPAARLAPKMCRKGHFSPHRRRASLILRQALPTRASSSLTVQASLSFEVPVDVTSAPAPRKLCRHSAQCVSISS